MAVTSGAVTIAEIRQWMNDTFVSKVEDQLNREILAVELFKQHNTGFTDGQAIVPINYARNTSASYRSENAALPDSGEIGRARLSVDAKYLYSRMSLTGPSIESGRNNPNGLRATLQEEIDGALESLSNRANNYFFSGGGVIGYICTDTADLNANAADFFGNGEHLDSSAFPGASLSVDLIRMDTYAIVNGAAGTNVGLRVSAASDTAQFKVETLAVVDCSNVPLGVPIAVRVRGDQVYADTTTETVADQTVGIMSNLSLQSHFGLDRTSATATYASLQSNFVDKCATGGAGVDFTSSMLQELFTKIQRQSDKRPDVLFVEHGFMDQYVSILTTTASSGNFRINQTTGKGADAGFNTQQMSYGSVPFRASRHAPKGCVIALAPSTWAHVTLKGPGMADLDGNVLSRITDKDAYEAYARYYHNLAAKRPNANGILTGIMHS